MKYASIYLVANSEERRESTLRGISNPPVSYEDAISYMVLGRNANSHPANESELALMKKEAKRL